MTAATLRITEQAWQRIHIAVLLKRDARSNQRSALECGLDDEHARAQSADKTIAARKVVRVSTSAEGKLRDDCANRGDLFH